ncbi:glycosyltransferase family 4 protein [Planctomycetota bacterium]
MTTYLCVYFGSAYLALFLTPLVIWTGRRINAVDRPGVRSVHTRPIPRIGGVAIFVSAMTLIIAVLFLNNGVGEAFRAFHLQLVTLLCSALFIFLIGLVDDLRGLPARFKFIAECAAAIALCVAGVRIDHIALTSEWVIHLGGFGCVLTLLWIVGVTNAVNLSDGLDGLAAGIAAIACMVIAVFAVYRSDVVMAVFMLALLGSLTGFLIFNVNPAKIFMGDCGSLFLGFIIASSSVLCVAKSMALVGLALPALALGIPIFDTLFCMLRRFLERRSMFAPDRRHVHHRLLDLGLKHRHVVIAIHSATILVAGLGLFMLVQENIGSLIIFGCLLLVLVLMFRVVGAVRVGDTLTRLRSKYEMARQNKEDRRTFEDLQLRFQSVQNADQWWQVVCAAGESMEFAWMSLKTTHSDGRTDEEVWRHPEEPEDPSRIIEMTIPIKNGSSPCRREISIAISINGGSLENASNRACLFGRLMDENLSSVGPLDSQTVGDRVVSPYMVLPCHSQTVRGEAFTEGSKAATVRQSDSETLTTGPTTV